MMKIRYYLFFLICAFGFSAQAADNSVNIKIVGEKRCIFSNGQPNHKIGQFPNKGNPNRFRQQEVQVCVDANPTFTGRIDRKANGSGITITGIIIRPGTADWYDASSPRGFSRDRSSGWNLEGMGPANTLGLDSENAHVDNRGLYHYHGVSPSLASSLNGTLIGYAADGHEIHFIGDKATSSWRLKTGQRSTKPFGEHDGTYNEDYEYIAGSGNLDECNGARSDGKYLYFATNKYPFFPRCFLGRVSKDFKGRP